MWDRIFETLTADQDNEYLMFDSAIVRAHQQATNGKGRAALGRSRGSLTIRIHMLVDTLGHPLRFSNVIQSQALLMGQKEATVIADKADGRNALRNLIAQMGTKVVPSL
ncbi:hypothetical protein JCM25156A_31250 [Komagataeibacter kakiaceti JCM 25156]